MEGFGDDRLFTPPRPPDSVQLPTLTGYPSY